MKIRIAAVLLASLPALASAQTAAGANTPAKTSKDDKVICRSETEVGSLVASKKECKTKREWDADRQATQARVGDCVNSGSATGARC